MSTWKLFNFYFLIDKMMINEMNIYEIINIKLTEQYNYL